MAIIFAQSTGAIIALAGIAILFGLINKTRLYAVGAIIAAAIFSTTPLKQPFANEVLSRHFGQLRLNMWGETVEMLKTHPILGAGLANYQTAVRPWHILRWTRFIFTPIMCFTSGVKPACWVLSHLSWLIILFQKNNCESTQLSNSSSLQ